MTEKRCLKSKFSIMKVFGILFLLLMSTITVQAAANPLADPTFPTQLATGSSHGAQKYRYTF